MSIATSLTKLETDITNAYNTINTKGGTIPSNKNTENLSTAINSISGGGGGKPEQNKTVTPTTSLQTILPDEGYTLSSVTVNAVDSSIDNNIQAENIKQGINILGIEGTFKDQANEIVDRSFTTLNITTDTIGSFALRDAINLATINAPNLTKVLTNGCYGCTNLKNINTTNPLSVETNSFTNCRNLEDFDFEISQINLSSFTNCKKITKIICTTSLNRIGTGLVFSGCSSLKTLVLRKTGSVVVTLSSVNCFDNTPFRNGEGGTVYVPNNLISSYQSATNWSSLESTTFKAIEGSIYE